MIKLLFTLYFTCYFCYIFYTRVPDYFDGETVEAIIKIDAVNNLPKAVYTINKKVYEIDVKYPFRNLKAGESVTIIYQANQPEKAAVYSLWGYWFTWNELIMSVVLLFGLYKLATSIVQNPTAEALIDQMEKEDEPIRKYNF
ncbi:MAG: hypothetical protein ACOVO1_11005 [Chitinophagaceae bacterium]